MAQEIKPGEMALVKAARTLDQGGFETIPDRLDQILKILEEYPGGYFHSAKEMILRWLLKNMNGPSEDAERLRRHPPTWQILAILFSTIPLFSLAKSLADRRFVVVLQATVKDVSEARQSGNSKDGESSDTEMVDAVPEEAQPRPSKRKKLDPVSFDLETQRRIPNCLRAADGLFSSLNALLDRLEQTHGGSGDNDPMGGEHIKSLFSSHANVLKDILAPALIICEMAMDNPEVLRDAQLGTWISTISSILDLQIKNQSDAVDIATHLSRTSFNIIRRLIGPRPPLMSPEVKTRWVHDLRRFLTRNLILPARATFVNRKTIDVMEMAVHSASSHSPTCLPVIFDLVLSSPGIVGSQSAKRENDAWTQAFFDIIEGSLRASSSEEAPDLMLTMMDMVHERRSVLSTSTLHSICDEYALHPNSTNWPLLLRIAEIDCDVFITGDRQPLLRRTLERTSGDDWLHGKEFEAAKSFIITLAAGYAGTRDLSGFIMKWFQYLALTEPHLKPKTNRSQLWYNTQLIKTVANCLEISMNTKQISSLLDWLDSHNSPAENAAVTLILAAISEAITQDEVIDAVGTRLFDMVYARRTAKSLPDGVSASGWRVTERSIEWGSLAQAESIWTQIGRELNEVVSHSQLADEATFAAFRCSIAAWFANYPGGKHEGVAASTAFDLLARVEVQSTLLGEKSDPTVTPYVRYILTDGSRISKLYAEKKGVYPKFVVDVLSSLLRRLRENEGREVAVPSLPASEIISEFLGDEDIVDNSNALSSMIIDVVRGGHIEIGAWNLKNTRTAVEYLHAVPVEAITREQRESIMSRLMRWIPPTTVAVNTNNGPISVMNSTTGVMINLMARPTFYEGMKFGHLQGMGEYLAVLARLDKQHAIAVMKGCLPLLSELASLTFKQMTSNIDKREREYLQEAVSQCLDWPVDRHFHDGIVRMVLLRPLIYSLGKPSILQALPGLDVQGLKESLGVEVSRTLRHFRTEWKEAPQEDWDVHLTPLLTVLDVAGTLGQEAVSRIVSPSLACLLNATEQLELAGNDLHWDLKSSLVRLFNESLEALRAKSDRGSKSRPQPTSSAKNDVGTSDAGFDKAKIVEFVDTAIQNMDEDAKLEYLQALLTRPDGLPCQTSQLPSAYIVIRRLEGARPNPDAASSFSLSVAHSTLCKKLRVSSTAAEFVLVAQMLHSLLEKPSGMTQWNIEVTLSTVSVLSSEATTHPVVSTCPKVYEWLCRLVQIVLKRHRLRLEGHFHLLVTTLQSLLHSLLSHPYSSAGNALASPGPITNTAQQHPHWEAHARLFSRLLTLVCEPSAASVSRSQPGTLDSATDAAKRSAGQHMYLVLMLYVKLQLEHIVPRAVKEAIEPGVFSVLDVTAPETRKIANDAMDASGRAVMKELYKQYLKFGKWSGV